MNAIATAFMFLVLTAGIVSAGQISGSGGEMITNASRVITYQGILRDSAGEPVPDAFRVVSGLQT